MRKRKKERRLQVRYTVDVQIAARIELIDEYGKPYRFFDEENELVTSDNRPSFAYRLGIYDSFEKAEHKTMKIIMDNKEDIENERAH